MSQRRPIAKAAFIPRPATSKSFISVNPAGFKKSQKYDKCDTCNITKYQKLVSIMML